LQKLAEREAQTRIFPVGNGSWLGCGLTIARAITRKACQPLPKADDRHFQDGIGGEGLNRLLRIDFFQIALRRQAECPISYFVFQVENR
jgi:hypothetical protein